MALRQNCNLNANTERVDLSTNVHVNTFLFLSTPMLFKSVQSDVYLGYLSIMSANVSDQLSL